MRRRAFVVAALHLALSSCGPKPLPPPPAAPRVTDEAALVPRDLDVVVRLDLGKLRASLGPEIWSQLAAQALGQGASAADERLLRSIERAELVYYAFRPGTALAPLDRVIALRGRFDAAPRATASLRGPFDLGGDARYYEPAERPPREGVARFYEFGDDRRLFVSEAEIDAVERVLRGDGEPSRWTAPARGALSFAARPLVLAPWLGQSALGELILAADSLAGYVDLESDRATGSLELELSNSNDADRLAQAVTDVSRRRLAGTPLAGAITATANETRLVVRGSVSRDLLAAALACTRAGERCPW